MSRVKLVAGREKVYADTSAIPGFILASVNRIDADYQLLRQPGLQKRQRVWTVVNSPPMNNDTLGLFEKTEQPFTIGFTYTVAGVDKNVVYEVILKQVDIDTDAADVQTITATFMMEDEKYKSMVVPRPHP